MSLSADVRSIEALKDFRNHLCQFGTDASDALCAVQLQIQRAFDWLEDQMKFWQRAIRDCQEEVIQAKNELAARKFPNALGRIPDCTVQEENLERAERRLEYAEEKLETARRWCRQLLPFAVTEYEGPSRQLAVFLEGPLPQALALLDRKIATLEQYLALTAPSTERSAPASSSVAVEPKPAATPAPSPAGG